MTLFDCGTRSFAYGAIILIGDVANLILFCKRFMKNKHNVQYVTR